MSCYHLICRSHTAGVTNHSTKVGRRQSPRYIYKCAMRSCQETPPRSLLAVPPFPIPPHPPGGVRFHTGVYDELTPPEALAFVASIDDAEWRHAAEDIGVSAGSILQINRRSQNSSCLKVTIEPSGPFLAWGYCKLLIHLVECMYM